MIFKFFLISNSHDILVIVFVDFPNVVQLFYLNPKWNTVNHLKISYTCIPCPSGVLYNGLQMDQRIKRKKFRIQCTIWWSIYALQYNFLLFVEDLKPQPPLFPITGTKRPRPCVDHTIHCTDWFKAAPESCDPGHSSFKFMRAACQKTCGRCGNNVSLYGDSCGISIQQVFAL